MNRGIVIVGNFHEIIELVEECGWTIHGMIDSPSSETVTAYPILASDETIESIAGELPTKNLVISPDQPLIRSRLAEIYHRLGFSFPILISPGAKICSSSTIQEGTVVQWGCNISAACQIGRFVKINTAANVMHDSKIGDFTTVAPGATVLGRVEIGVCSYIGANATILPNIRIGENVTIGAGAVVTKDVPPGTTFVGVPAMKLIQKRRQ